MSPDEFRRHGHAMVDWIADYWASLQQRPEQTAVLSRAKPGDVAAMLPTAPPMRGEEWGTIAADIDRVVMPGITHWQHPQFHAFFPANNSGPSVLGELLSAGLGVQGMVWATSPACTEIETRVLDWLAGMIGLPDSFLSSGSGGSVIHGTASEATLAAMLAARARVLAALPAGTSPHLTLYTSSQAHSSVIKAAMIAGLARDPDDRSHLRLIEVDDQYRMNPARLAEAIRTDRGAGRVPMYVCATVGTTGVTAIDSIAAVADVLATEVPIGLPRPWLHVDAAHAGAACVCPEYQHWLAGIERADSLCMNPHKWLLTNFDCDCFFTRDRASLLRALSILPEYLRNPSAGAATQPVIDYRDWQVPLGRRFRALKLWFVIRHYGVEGLRSYIRGHMRLATICEELLREGGGFEIVAPRTMNLVCFRCTARPGETSAQTDERTRLVQEAVNASGRAYLTHTKLLDGRFVLRIAIGSVNTLEKHIQELAAWLHAANR